MMVIDQSLFGKEREKLDITLYRLSFAASEFMKFSKTIFYISLLRVLKERTYNINCQNKTQTVRVYST